jgi:hypothetical protein
MNITEHERGIIEMTTSLNEVLAALGENVGNQFLKWTVEELISYLGPSGVRFRMQVIPLAKTEAGSKTTTVLAATEEPGYSKKLDP